MADKPKKPQKLKARLPRGLEDRGPAEITATRAMVEKIRAVYELYGFEPVETPAFEYTDALGKFLPDQDRPNEGVFSFMDDDEQWISLRYDLTAPLARYVAENFDTLPKPYRSYRFGWVFRNEKPGPGRFRQFMQFDADTVGSGTMAADAEICMMGADIIEKLGIARGAYVVKVNNRKLLDGILEANGLDGRQNETKRLIVLRAIDKTDRLGPAGVRELLGEGRKDASGDFTPGAGLASHQIESIMQFVGWKKIADEFFLKKYDDSGLASNSEVIEALRSVFGKNKTSNEGLDELQLIANLVDVSGYKDRVRIDPSVVRGLEYYTGPVYEIEIYINDDKGRPVSFGSVGGGGRYDGLVSRFRGEPVPATGFSIGVSRLQFVLDSVGQFNANRTQYGPVVVTMFDRDRVADYQKMVAVLRDAGIRAELYLGNPKNMANQFKYADRRNSPCVIVQGSDEKARGEIQIKDMIEGAKGAAAIASNQEWRESRLAQIACREEEIVAKVREVLARHDVRWGN